MIQKPMNRSVSSFAWLLAVSVLLASPIVAQKLSPVGKWNIEYRECNDTKWEPYGWIRFLPKGKVENPDYPGYWRLQGAKFYALEPSNTINELRLTVHGNVMSGTADIGVGMPKLFCARLSRVLK